MKFLPKIGQFILSVFLAAVAVALTSGVLIAFRGLFSTSVIALLYLLIVVLCTTLRGYRRDCRLNPCLPDLQLFLPASVEHLYRRPY